MLFDRILLWRGEGKARVSAHTHTLIFDSKYCCKTRNYFGFGRLYCLLCWGGVGSYQKNLVLSSARTEHFYVCELEGFYYACIVQMVLFSFWKEKRHLRGKKKRFGGEALQWYFTSIHLSSLMARKLTAWFSSSTLRQR